jgi:acetyl esterase/lipase
VPVTVARYDGQMHGFLTMGSLLPTGAAALNESIEQLRRALSGVGDGTAVA